MRYRFDFAPCMLMAPLIGHRAISFTAAGTPGSWRKRLGIAAVGLCVPGILGDHCIRLVSKVWTIAVSMRARPRAVALRTLRSRCFRRLTAVPARGR